MRESYHPADYDFRSIYYDLSMYRGFEGGAVYVARGAGEWVVITDEGTLIDLLSEEDQAGEWEHAIHIYSFATEGERNTFALSRYGPKRSNY